MWEEVPAGQSANLVWKKSDRDRDRVVCRGEMLQKSVTRTIFVLVNWSISLAPGCHWGTFSYMSDACKPYDSRWIVSSYQMWYQEQKRKTSKQEQRRKYYCSPTSSSFPSNKSSPYPTLPPVNIRAIPRRAYVPHLGAQRLLLSPRSQRGQLKVSVVRLNIVNLVFNLGSFQEFRTDLVEVSLAGIRFLWNQSVFLWCGGFWGFFPLGLIIHFPWGWPYRLPTELVCKLGNPAVFLFNIQYCPSWETESTELVKLIPWRHFYRRARFISCVEEAQACMYVLAQAFSLSRALRFLSTLLMFPMHVFALSLRQSVMNFVNSTSSAPAALNNFFCLFV